MTGPASSDYDVRPVPAKIGRAFIIDVHYSKGCHNGPMTYGLYAGQALIGVLAVATPCSENVRAALFGPARKAEVSELHRLAVLDGTPTNTETWFMARALRLHKQARPHQTALVSFADATEGHRGTIYQAMNALYTGKSGRARFYLDQGGRLRHPRQNGHNITPNMASERGWTPTMREAKHRYVLLMPDGPAHKRALRRDLLLPSLPYPKATA